MTSQMGYFFQSKEKPSFSTASSQEVAITGLLTFPGFSAMCAGAAPTT